MFETFARLSWMDRYRDFDPIELYCDEPFHGAGETYPNVGISLNIQRGLSTGLERNDSVGLNPGTTNSHCLKFRLGMELGSR